jgi:hypothetical protein
MFKVIFKVEVGLAFLAYSALFLSWNMGAQPIISWQMMGVTYSQPLPVGGLAFIGLILGAVIMAVACWTAYASQKAHADKAVATVKKAKVKLQAQLDTIVELREEVDSLKAQIADLQAGDGTWGQTVYPEGETPPPAEGASQEEVDDDEVI